MALRKSGAHVNKADVCPARLTKRIMHGSLYKLKTFAFTNAAFTFTIIAIIIIIITVIIMISRSAHNRVLNAGVT